MHTLQLNTMIKENVFKIKGRISLICAKARCNPQDISIVAVSKGRTIEQIREAIEAGITDIGENRVQEALSKYNVLYASAEGGSASGGKRYTLNAIKWHMVGHLQTNKVKEAVGMFDLIHSVDSLRLAKDIDKEAGKINKVQGILIQVNISSEATKFGLKPEETVKMIKEISEFKNISVKGLMSIAPLSDNPKESRSYFRMLRELRDKINTLTTNDYRLPTLSMGMTDDFEVAIEEGSNMVRLGRAIFEG